MINFDPYDKKNINFSHKQSALSYEIVSCLLYYLFNSIFLINEVMKCINSWISTFRNVYFYVFYFCISKTEQLYFTLLFPQCKPEKHGQNSIKLIKPYCTDIWKVYNINKEIIWLTSQVALLMTTIKKCLVRNMFLIYQSCQCTTKNNIFFISESDKGK